MHKACKHILAACLLFFAAAGHAQDWPSPEVEQMYNTARNYMTNGNLQQAIVTYRQAIQLAPDQMILHRDLGRAYYLSGNSPQAEEILDPILKSGEADEQTFQIMASIQSASNDKKKAKSTLQKGLGKYPSSGILYHDMGKMYEDDNDPEQALGAYLDGIRKDPAYHVNYYEAARMYMIADKPVWTIIYGEMFVNIEQFTPRSQEMREMLLNAYKKIYYTVPQGDLPKFSKNAKTNVAANNFETAVLGILLKLSPIVTDGVNTENLTMLRSRFIMDWVNTYGNKYPFALYNYHDKMLRSGYFDAYNQWLFGKAENAQQYDAWLAFHKDAMPQFQAWQQQNKFTPTSGDFYNTRQVQGLFDAKEQRSSKKDSKR